MKPTDNIHKLIKKLQIEPSADMDKKVHSRITKALEKWENTKSASLQTDIWKSVFQNRITKLVAAAMIIVAICLFFVHQGPNGRKEMPGIAQVVVSPAELTTFASFSFAYRKGGMEMVEKVFDQALKQAGQRPANISMQEFFEEINNGKSERTRL